MAEGVFKILEIGDGDPTSADAIELFEWTADSKPATPFDGTKGGGARACPIKPWGIPGQQRVIRVNYPNAKVPTAQVLGPVEGKHVFSGRLDDRYNGAGYARFEWRRLLAMFQRGRFVRVSFGDIAYEGIVEDWNFDVNRLWDIAYHFTIDVYNEASQTDRSRVPITPADPVTALANVNFAVQATLDVDDRAPRNALTGTLANDVSTRLTAMVAAVESLGATVEHFVSGAVGKTDAVFGAANKVFDKVDKVENAFTRIATQFRGVKAAAFALTTRLASVRSDTEMSQRTVMDVLDFEDWSRSLRYMARLSAGISDSADRDATEHAAPSAVRLYRPAQGEHLYQISRKFYATPFAWQLIYERNALTSITMRGNETLIIPERGAS